MAKKKTVGTPLLLLTTPSLPTRPPSTENKPPARPAPTKDDKTATMASVPSQIAETVQTAHIKRDPSPAHDVNPPAAGSTMQPARAVPKRRAASVDLDDDLDDDDDEIPVSVLRPQARKTSFPPMPDLRFEQSYLNSLRDADTWWKIAWVTVRDQVRFLRRPNPRGVSRRRRHHGCLFWGIG